MPKANGPIKSKLSKPVFFTIAALVLVSDELTKLLVRSSLSLGESFPETGFFRIKYVQNTGGAFGIFQDGTLILAILNLVGAVVILYLIFNIFRFPILNDKRIQFALSLILGGSLGNMLDRFFIGYVTDFIAIGSWPPFNIADSAVVCGSLLLGLLLILRYLSNEDDKETETNSQ